MHANGVSTVRTWFPAPRQARAAAFLLLVVLPLLTGGAIYLAFRSRTLVMFAAAERAGLGDVVNAIRWAAHPLRPHLPPWFVFSLPNALWTLSLVSLLGLLWEQERDTARAWMAVAGLLAVMPEILQWAQWFPGTFSGDDLAGGLLAVGVAALCIHLLPPLHPRRS